MVYIALTLSIIGLLMAYGCHRRNAGLRERISETNSRIYNLRRSYLEAQERAEKELSALKYALLKARGELSIEPEMKIGDILTIHPQAQQVLAGFHLGGCSSCSVDDRQSLAEAAAVNGRDVAPILVALNSLITENGDGASSQQVKTPNVELHF